LKGAGEDGAEEAVLTIPESGEAKKEDRGVSPRLGKIEIPF
jgi:hypothetical protein